MNFKVGGIKMAVKIENEKLEFQNRLKIERDLWDKGIEYLAAHLCLDLGGDDDRL